MKSIDCQWLDDYLAGELPCDWVPLFEQHLQECPACGEEVTQWRELRAELSRASRALETPPDTLWRSIAQQCALAPAPPREPSRPRRLAVAVAVCLAVGLFFTTISTQQDLPQRDNAVDQIEVATPRPVTRMELPDNVIGVPIDIDDPDVTVVWVYPVYQPAEANE
jgi:anti-sigma factor RsiW